MNEKTPKSLRLQIGIFGRTNVGKSSFLNYIAGQDIAITSPVPGTTTDVVEKPMELLPIGPVLFLDTAGLDDVSGLAGRRLEKTEKIFPRADIYVLVVEPGAWGEFEERVASEARRHAAPLIVVVNKIDRHPPRDDFMQTVSGLSAGCMTCSCADAGAREHAVDAFKGLLIKVCPDDFLNAPALLGDLVPSCGTAVMIVPIDLQAPKGRLILPQVQAIRDALDNDASVLVVKERE
ncbi:MAG TPA: 50S ribosome-binding GTPase, partial [bacterium]|nr:50S ribosome-binding GTPase [bacterium]